MQSNLFGKISSQKLRKFIIDNIRFIDPIPYRKAFYAVMNPTDFCPVGCAHCLYSSRKLKSPKINKRLMNVFVKIADQANLRMLVFSGGGEPFENLERMLYAIENIKSLEDVIIITSAYFAKSSASTKNILDKLSNSANVRRKRKGFKKVIITLRISRDNHQCNIIPLQNIINVTNYAIDKSDFSKFRIIIRTILGDKENQDLELINRLNFKLLPKKNKENIYKNLPTIDGLPVRWMIGKNVEIPIIYKPVYFIGRGFSKKIKNIYSLWKIIESEKESGTPFNLCLRGSKGEGHNYYETLLKGYYFWRRALKGKSIYNAFKQDVDKQLAFYVTASGDVLINNGVPDIALNLKDIKSWNQFLKLVFKDPVQRLLIENGPFFVKDIAEEVEKDLIKRIEKINFVFALSLLSLETSALRSYVTIKVIQYYLKLGKIKIKNKDLERFIINTRGRNLVKLYEKWKGFPENKKAQNLRIKDPITADAESIYK